MEKDASDVETSLRKHNIFDYVRTQKFVRYMHCQISFLIRKIQLESKEEGNKMVLFE